MKWNNIYTYCWVLLISLISSCSNDDVGPSILNGDHVKSELDMWIIDEFTGPYNIKVDYRMSSADLDQSKVLVPVKEDLVKPFLQAVKKIWINPYIKASEKGADFMADYSNKQLILVGSGSYNEDQSVTLGLATNGYTITLYTVNSFDLKASVSKSSLVRFFQTMHHEFGHILNQRKSYDNNFQNITGGYSADWTAKTTAQARELGFISNYASSAHTEDFVEVFSYYICSTDQEWDSIISSIQNQNARSAINKKLLVVTSYMKDTYGVDIKILREEIIKAINEVSVGNLD